MRTGSARVALLDIPRARTERFLRLDEVLHVALEFEFVVMTDKDPSGRYFVGNHYVGRPYLLHVFQGQATTWDDAAIAADNPGAKLPSTPITVARRPEFEAWLAARDGDGGDA